MTAGLSVGIGATRGTVDNNNNNYNDDSVDNDNEADDDTQRDNVHADDIYCPSCHRTAPHGAVT